MAGDIITLPSAAQQQRQAHMLPSSFEEATRMATALAKSNLFGCKTAEQAFALMLLADAEGLHPAAAARDYHIIDGKPSLKADAMLARYMAAGGKVKWLKRKAECVSAEFTHPSSGSVVITWDKDRATLAGFWGKPNWRKHPTQMLSARVISEGVRASFPGVVSGVYTPEEVADFEPSRPVHTVAHDTDGVIVEDSREALPPPQSVPGAISASQVGRDMADAIRNGSEPGLKISERAKPKSPAEQKAEADFKALEADLNSTDSKAALNAWLMDNKDACAALPEPFKSDIRTIVNQHMAHWKRVAEEADYAARAAEEANREFAQ